MFRAMMRGLGALERVATTIAASFMFVIMIVVFSDVIMRYVFNRPFSWAYDLIALYLMTGVFFLVLSSAYAEGAHVSVDILQQRFPPAAIRLTELVTGAIGFVIFALIAYLGFVRAADSLRASDVLAGAIPWPMWPSIGLVPLGAGLLALRLALQFIGNALSLVTGQNLVELPRSHAGTEGETFE